MTDQLSAVQNEQKRQSEELSAMRGMHVELMKGVGDLVTKLGIFEVQHREVTNRLAEMRQEVRGHGDKIEAIRISQASNEFIISTGKSLARNALLAMLGGAGSVGAAIFMAVKAGGGA